MQKNNNLSMALHRNTGIDILRGLSIILVVMHHVGLRIPLKDGLLSHLLPKWFLNGLVYNGYEAVFVFFVISGFLITLNSLHRWGSLAIIQYKNFYVRRAARILPCLIILILVLSLFHLLGFSNYVIKHEGQSLGGAIFSALGLHLNWYEGHHGYLPANWDVLWSLSIEEVFYICFPIVCLVVRRNWILIFFLVLLALSLPFSRAALSANEIWQEKAYLPGMAAIATGVLGALIVFKYNATQRWILWPLFTCGSAGLLLVLFFEGLLWHMLGNGTMLVLTLSTLLLLLTFYWQQNNKIKKPFVGLNWLCSFGRLSYEIYLTHMFIVWPIVKMYHSELIPKYFGFIWYFPALILCWFLGLVVCKYISFPFERQFKTLAGARTN